MLNIAIIGCGYVGTRLAKYWQEKGHYITGTTRSRNRLTELHTCCQKAEILHSSDLEKLSMIIKDNEVIVLTIAADSPEDYENVYLNTTKGLRKVAKSGVLSKKLLYTSSTFVYGDHHGRWVDELSTLLNKTEPGKVLIETESELNSLHEFGWDICILRLAEIYGPERELIARVKKFQGATLPGNGKNYTNMIHSSDIIHAMDYTLRHNLEGVYNLCDDDHPTREDLYNRIATDAKLKKIKWDPKIQTIRLGNKRVSNHKIKSAGYEFLNPHRAVE